MILKKRIVMNKILFLGGLIFFFLHPKFRKQEILKTINDLPTFFLKKRHFFEGVKVLNFGGWYFFLFLVQAFQYISWIWPPHSNSGK